MTSTWRRLTAVLAASAFTLLSVPSLAMAAAPSRTTDETHVVIFGPMSVGGATLEGHVGFSTLDGPRAGLVYDGPNGLIYGVTGWAERDRNRVVGDLYLIDSDSGESPGWATYDLEFTAAGAVESSESVVRDGNHRVISKVTEQAMLANGAVTMHDGTVFRLAGVPADLLTQELWVNGPQATILDGYETFVEAAWEIADMTVVFRMNVTALDAAGIVYVSTPQDPEIIGTARPELVDDRASAEYTLRRLDRSIAGTASVDLAIATLGSSTSFEETEFSRTRVTSYETAVVGDLSLILAGTPYELSFADAVVTSYRLSWHGVQYPFADDGQG